MDIACITARNEAQSIAWLVRELRQQGITCVVVDDGSVDGTGYLARAAGAITITSGYSRGIADGLLKAWRVALDMQPDRILQIDAGGSHLPREAYKLLSALDGADMVIGSRFIHGGKYLGGYWYRPLMSRIAAFLCSWRVGWWLDDWTSGYRAYKPKTLQRLLEHQYQAKMHGFQIESLSWAIGMKIAEVPITYLAGRSSFNWKVAKEAFKVWRSL